MNPPPPRLPARGSVTARAKPTATAASTALPPRSRISTPTRVARASWLATMPFGASAGCTRAASEMIGQAAGAAGGVCACPATGASASSAAATRRVPYAMCPIP